MPVRKVFLEKSLSEREIPTPTWKQFIATENAIRGETMRRALFWYREALIGGIETRGRIVASWSAVHLTHLERQS